MGIARDYPSFDQRPVHVNKISDRYREVAFSSAARYWRERRLSGLMFEGAIALHECIGLLS
jgi:hypothetical protein